VAVRGRTPRCRTRARALPAAAARWRRATPGRQQQQPAADSSSTHHFDRHGRTRRRGRRDGSHLPWYRAQHLSAGPPSPPPVPLGPRGRGGGGGGGPHPPPPPPPPPSRARPPPSRLAAPMGCGLRAAVVASVLARAALGPAEWGAARGGMARLRARWRVSRAMCRQHNQTRPSHQRAHDAPGAASVRGVETIHWFRRRALLGTCLSSLGQSARHGLLSGRRLSGEVQPAALRCSLPPAFE